MGGVQAERQNDDMSHSPGNRCEARPETPNHTSYRNGLPQRERSYRSRWLQPGSHAIESHFEHRNENRLLRTLAIDPDGRLVPEVESVHLRAGQVLAVVDDPMRHVYFPEGAVIELVAVMDDGTTTECATIGNEGMLGVEVFLGDGVARSESVVAVPGLAARMKAAAFVEAMERNFQLRSTVQHYTLALMNQLARTAACNTLHSVSERCARWLLMSGDRVGRDSLPLTHDSLAQLLAVRRASVTEALGKLQYRGIIKYQRGHITILDQGRLEEVACEDYRLCRDAYDRLYRSAATGVGAH
jgi:CRP-like cAMP-binding protein